MDQEPDIQPGISNARLAVLIDAENVSAELWPEIRRRIDLLGKQTVARALKHPLVSYDCEGIGDHT